MNYRFIIVVLSVFLLAACSNLVPQAPATLSPMETRGRRVFEANCSRCHSSVGDIIVVGPSLAGVASRAGKRIAGMAAAAYIRNSIEEPGAYTVEGFPKGIMPPNFKEALKPEDLDAVIAYLLTLK